MRQSVRSLRVKLAVAIACVGGAVVAPLAVGAAFDQDEPPLPPPDVVEAQQQYDAIVADPDRVADCKGLLARGIENDICDRIVEAADGGHPAE